MTDRTDRDIVWRLKAACDRGWYLTILWPHKLLRDAIEEIEAARKLVRIWKAVAQTDAVHTATEVWTVTVVEDDRQDFLVFSSQEKAGDWAGSCPHPCVLSTRVVDVPEHYFEAAQ